MKLHESGELFKQLILTAGEEKRIHPALVEKDYYVTNILRYLSQAVPDMIFKEHTKAITKKLPQSLFTTRRVTMRR